MFKTKSGEIECCFFADMQSIVQSDPVNATELARIPRWSHEELTKRGYGLYRPSLTDERHKSYAKDEARYKKQGLEFGLQHFGVRR